MSEINLFERCTRLKVRFSSPQGLLSVEDLWDLPLTGTNPNRANLNDIAKGLHSQLKDEEVSFVPTAKKAEDLEQALLNTMFETIKHIIGVKVAERDAREAAAEKAKKKQVLLAALAAAEAREVDAKSPEEIRKMIDAMD
jgi:hypothetical protein